jgi:hypothetical protein
VQRAAEPSLLRPQDFDRGRRVGRRGRERAQVDDLCRRGAALRKLLQQRERVLGPRRVELEAAVGARREGASFVRERDLLVAAGEELRELAPFGPFAREHEPRLVAARRVVRLDRAGATRSRRSRSRARRRPRAPPRRPGAA